MKRLTISLLLSLCLLFSFQAYGQIIAESAGGSPAVTETSTTYTITKTNIVLAGDVTITTVSFVTAVATTSLTVGSDALDKNGSVIWVDADGGTGNAAIASDGLTFSGFSGGVGIGGAPGTLLQLLGADAYLTLQNTTDENGDGEAETIIIFEDHANATLAQIRGSHFGAGDDTQGRITFLTNTGSGLQTVMMLDKNQFVGIGTLVPDQRLVVTSGAAATEAKVTSTGTAVTVDLRVENTSGGATVLPAAFGATSSGTYFGITKNDMATILFTGATNNTIGSIDATPLILGANNAEVLRLVSGGSVAQETYVIRKHIVLTGATDNAATNIFTITTADETGSADGGAYSVTVHILGHEAIAASGATNVSSISLLAHWTRAMQSAGTGSNSAITEISESASADLGSGAITAITLTVTETSEFVQQVLLQINTSNGVFDGWAIVELVYSDFTTAPVIASN